ncbi:MAG: ABC transporter ATP-binding protein [Pseudohongiellaceae bacterium]
MKAISIKNLEYTWPKALHTSLQIPQFTVQQGESVFLQGDSGSGKSTFLSVLAGVLPASAGSVNILGTELTDLSNKALDKFRARHIGIVFQQFNLVPFLSVAANLRLAARFANQSRQQTQARSLELIEALRLHPNLLERQADRLSVGQQQRVAIARAFINQPEIILADEPTSALDANARDQFVKLLLSIRDVTGCAIVFVSHDQSLASFFDSHQSLADINLVHSKEDNYV